MAGGISDDVYNNKGTINELWSTFTRWKIPQQIVTENGLQFVSEMFQKFTSYGNTKRANLPQFESEVTYAGQTFHNLYCSEMFQGY